MSLKKYLEQRGAVPADPKIIENYERQMREVAIPKIIEDIRANAKRVAEIRQKVLF